MVQIFDGEGMYCYECQKDLGKVNPNAKNPYICYGICDDCIKEEKQKMTTMKPDLKAILDKYEYRIQKYIHKQVILLEKELKERYKKNRLKPRTPYKGLPKIKTDTFFNGKVPNDLSDFDNPNVRLGQFQKPDCKCKY